MLPVLEQKTGQTPESFSKWEDTLLLDLSVVDSGLMSRKETKQAFESTRPTTGELGEKIEGLTSALNWRTWIVGVAFAALASAIGWLFVYHLPAKIESQTKGLSNGVASLTTDVGNLRSDVQRIEGKVDGLLKDALNGILKSLKGIKHQSSDLARKRLQLAADLAKAAGQAGIQVDTKTVAEAGKNALESTDNPRLADAAWQTTLQLVNYRSFLNAGLAPNPKNPVPISEFKGEWSYDLMPAGTPSSDVGITVVGLVPRERAAVMEFLQNPLNADAKFGPEFLIIDGAPLSLDGVRLKNVIFRNSRIVYRGGPMQMDNVYFVNCTFEVPRRPNGQELCATLLASTATTFKTS